MHPTANLLPLAVFKKLKIFLEKPIFFSKVSQVSIVLRYLTNSVVFYSKFATFGNFVRKSQFLFEKHNNLFNKTNFWTFWQILFFQWPCTATMLHLVILKKSRILSKTPLFFFQQKPKFWTFRENLLHRLHSASNWLLWVVFNETQEFFRITNVVSEISVFVTCWEISLSLSHSTANLLTLSLFWKIGFFSNKTHPFFKENTQFSKVLKTCTLSVAL